MRLVYNGETICTILQENDILPTNVTYAKNYETKTYFGDYVRRQWHIFTHGAKSTHKGVCFFFIYVLIVL